MIKKRSKGKVMIVDDDPISLKITSARLKQNGYEVVVKEGSLGALMAILKEKPAIILLDLNMPNIGGENLMRMIQEQFQSNIIPVILHSGLDLATLQEKAKTSGALGAIAKTDNDKLFMMQFERLFGRARSGFMTP